MDLDQSTIAAFPSPFRGRDTGMVEVDSTIDHVAPPSDMQVFKIRMANSQGVRESASLLLKKMYSWRGYAFEAPDVEPNNLMLAAETAGKTVGTMTLCFDSAVGLPADENFHDELKGLRAQGRRLCEPSRLAIDRDVPKRVFAALMHISYIYSHKIHVYTDYVIEVNPRHAAFYKRMLGFQELGSERMCTRVNAPAVLLRLECQYMAGQIAKFGGLFENHGREKSFYPYFFSSRDEQGITGRFINGLT